MAFTGPIEDRLLIRERMNASADATFRGDVEAYLDCWAEDGVRRHLTCLVMPDLFRHPPCVFGRGWGLLPFNCGTVDAGPRPA